MYAHIFMCVHIHTYIEKMYICVHTEKEKRTERQKVANRELNDK